MSELKNRTRDAAMTRALENLKQQHVASVEVRQVAAGVDAALAVLTGPMTRLAQQELHGGCCRGEHTDQEKS